MDWSISYRRKVPLKRQLCYRPFLLVSFTSYHPLQSVLNIKIVRYLPSWLPGLGFLERVASCRRLAKEVWNQPFEYTKNEVVRDLKGFLLVMTSPQ